MNEFMSLAVVAFKYIAAFVITLMAFKAAYERSKGGDLKSLIVGFLTFVGVFWAFIVLFPVLFNIGFSKVYNEVEHSPHVDNLTKLAGAGVQLVMANPQTVSLNVPQVDAATELGSVLSLPSVTTNSAAEPVVKTGNGEPTGLVEMAPSMPAALPVAKPAANVQGPMSQSYFHPAPHDDFTGENKPVYRPGYEPTAPALPNTSNPTLAGPGETIEQYKARTGDDGGPQTYTVKSGDSLATVARAQGVSVSDLCNANLGVVRNNCNLLRSGMVLVIP